MISSYQSAFLRIRMGVFEANKVVRPYKVTHMKQVKSTRKVVDYNIDNSSTFY